jgi:hypothetical protein
LFCGLTKGASGDPGARWSVCGGNTAEGGSALLSRTTGGFDTAIGAAALLSDTTGSSNTAVGANSLRLLTIGSGNTAVGVQPLFNNNADGNTSVGGNALFSNTIGLQNVAVGSGALASNTYGSQSTAIGFQALNHNSVDQNVAVGFGALRANTTGDGNTATGTGALISNTVGFENTANGAGSLVGNISGSHNTATGFRALSSNIFGGANTAIGHNALYSNTNGLENTAVGITALYLNTGGRSNTAVGNRALSENVSGNLNIALGDQAGSHTTGSNNIDIGNPGAGEANTIRIGNTVAIVDPGGITHPAQTRTFIAGIRGRTTGNANAIPVLIDSAGQLGTASSSRRFKNEIKPMDKTSEAILALQPVTFHYKSDDTNTPQFGLIAEEVAKVNPDLIVRDENGEIYTVRYDAVNAMLLNEFLKEHRKVDQQGRTIREQEATIAQLKQDFQSRFVQEEKEIEALTAGLQKVSAQIEVSKPTPQTVLNQ